MRYFVNVIVNRGYNKLIEEEDFIVHNTVQEPLVNPPANLEIGIEGKLRLSFELERTKFYLEDCIIGRLVFNLIKIKIANAEILLIKREQFGSGQNAVVENKTVSKFEILDGTPTEGEEVNIRFHLSSTDLTPTYPNINNRFSCRYFLSLSILDEDERRYLKQIEVELWRSKV